MLFLCLLSRLPVRERFKLPAGMKFIQCCKFQFRCISSLRHLQNWDLLMILDKSPFCQKKSCMANKSQVSRLLSFGNITFNDNNDSCNVETPLELCAQSVTYSVKKKTANEDETISFSHELTNNVKPSLPNPDSELQNCESAVVIEKQEILGNYNSSLSESCDAKFKMLPKRGLDEIDFSNPDEDSVIIDEIEPVSPVSFNLAAYVNKSECLQQLIKLGVDLSKAEEVKGAARFLLNLNFERDIKPYIQFLHDIGVPTEDLGKLFTKNPLIFQEDLEHLIVRINYLESKKFSQEAIVRIVTANPFHLSRDTKYVDQRLGFFQHVFSLAGDEVRYLLTKCPKLITYNHKKFLEKLFVMKEEMGFSKSEMKRLLLAKPKVWMIGRKNLSKRFDIVHNIMGVPHVHILHFPGILLVREFILDQRHKYLASLGYAQYDPRKPGYVSLEDIATLSDAIFSRECAKTSILEFNEFLKTL